ncbi:MAG: amino acid adenylation domain-containing protein [Myxococcota bacterium]
MNDIDERIQALSPAKRALLELDPLEEEGPGEPIAIVGMGCRFPGGAHSPEAYWQLLREGVDAVGTVPPDRWTIPPNPSGPADPTSHGAFLDGVDQFDAAFFGISPREAMSMDPQHRLLLEVAWEALEDAGIPPDSLDGSLTGAFVGISTHDYLTLLGRHDPERRELYVVVGNALNGAPGRLSYTLGLRGPCMAVDTACSSSLVATHLACQSLRSGESNLALTAGVNLILTPEATATLARSGTMAADGRCKTFDAAADGYVRGEGCGVLVLERLDDAERNGHRIWGLVRGTAVGQDGRSGGLTVPSGAAQQALMRRALEDAEIQPHQVAYVEAHGTGTPLGDPIEIRALGAVYGGATRRTPLAVGSAKTNIGHTEAAAGVAGLMKVVLALRARQLPPHLHLQSVNPEIDLAAIPAVIPTALTDAWRDDEPRLAAVSSFGFTGAIAHAIVEAAPPTSPPPAPAVDERPLLLALSARSPEALTALADRYRDALADTEAAAQLCARANTHRSHHDHRLAILADTPAELCERLEAAARGDRSDGVWRGLRPAADRKIAFVFPGQGSQWRGMGRQLLATSPPFAATLHECDRLMHPLLGRSLVELLESEDPAMLEQIELLQPSLFAMQVALAAQWRAWGVTPRAVIGHSMGEVAAAHVAGALSLPDACRVICRRSDLVRPLIGRGTMAAVALSHADAQARIAPHADRVSVAVSNGPSSTVLSGDTEAIETILAELSAEGLFCRPVKVAFAAHSPQIDRLTPELHQALADLRPQPGSIPIYSTVTRGVVPGQDLDARYWARNLREPVHFYRALGALMEAGYDTLVEVSPHPVLTPAIDEAQSSLGTGAVVVGTLRAEHDERQAILASLGELYAQGSAVDWAAVSGLGGPGPLPTYPWQRQRYWVPTASPTTTAAATAPAPSGTERHPHLGARITTTPELSRFEVQLRETEPRYLDDHRINGVVVVPGSSHVSMLLSAAEVVFGDHRAVLENIVFPQALSLEDSGAATLALTLSNEDVHTTTFRVTSDSTTHATGTLSVGRSTPETPEPPEPNSAIRARCPVTSEGAVFYGEIREVGYHLGTTFQWLETIWRSRDEALARMRAPQRADEAQRYVLTPGLVDSCFQVLGASYLTEGEFGDVNEGGVFIPAGIDRFEFHHALRGGQLWCHAQVRARDDDEVKGDFVLYLDDGTVVARATGLCLRRARAEALQARGDQGLDAWFHEVIWRPLDPPAPEGEPPEATLPEAARWLLLADADGPAATIAEALTRQLDDAGQRCTVVPTDQAHTLDTSTGWHGVIDLRALLELEPPPTHAEHRTLDLLALVQALHRTPAPTPPRLWIVTRGTQPVVPDRAVSPGGAPLWGLGAVVDQEHPELRSTLIDLDPDDPTLSLRTLLVAGDERRLAVRRDSLYAARLVARPEAGRTAAPATAAADGRDFRLEIDRPGILGSLTLREFTPPPVGPNEVSIAVEASALNFLDVMQAMGIYPGLDLESQILLGGETSGTVLAVGEGVDDLRPGDEVIALGPGCMSTTVVAHHRYVARRPEGLTADAAVTLPLVFMTAYYALHDLGHLAAGERVLIHSASGGTGLAALQLAQRAGAEVFATAGTERKRAFLRELGVEHVMDSRSLDWAEQIMDHTDGQGVDVILNSLAGEAIPLGLRTLARYGRFLEISKRDIYQNQQLGLLPFKKSLSYIAVDLAGRLEARPQACARLFGQIIGLAAEGAIHPLEREVFDIAQASQGFARMARAAHIGKIVVTVGDTQPAAAVPVVPAAPSASIRADRCYLVTGGLGALGLEVADWLVSRGARHLALLGRRSPSAAAQARIDALTEAGARVHVCAADVSQRDQLAAALARLAELAPPLAGVIHAAGLLRDATIPNLTEAQLREVLAPKVAGAWHLHELTAALPLDLFVMFAAAAPLVGSPGQGAYAAANAFMDALAHHRRHQGLPALSIDWGPWAQVGLAAAQANRGDRLATKGIASIGVAQGLEALGRALDRRVAQVAVVPLDMATLSTQSPQLVRAPFFAELTDTTAPQDGDATFQAALAAADTEPARQRVLWDHVADQISAVLMIPPERLQPEDKLTTLGFDSLTALELKNRLQASLGASLPPTLVWNHDTVGALVAELPRPAAPATGRPAPSTALPTTLPTIVPDLDARYEPFPLTGTQQAYWVGRGDAIELGNVGCHAYQEVELTDFDLHRLNRAWQAMIERHDMLRMIVLPDGRQQIQRRVPFYEIEVLDLRDRSPAEAEAEVAAVRARMSHQVMDPGHWPLFEIRATRLPARDGIEPLRLHVSIDTLIGDAWSFRVLSQELETLYEDPAAPLPPLALTFRDYVLGEGSLDQTAPYQRSLAYWQARLPALPVAPELPLACAPKEIDKPHFVRRASRLSPERWARLIARAHAAGLTPTDILLAVYAEVLGQWAKAPRFTINVPQFNRLPLHPEVPRLVGEFASFTLVDVDVGGSPSFADQVAAVHDRLWDNLDHGLVPGVQLLRELVRLRRANRAPDDNAATPPPATMPVVFTSLLSLGSVARNTSLLGEQGEMVFSITQTPQVWLDLQVSEHAGAMMIHWDSVDGLFCEGVMDAMFAAYGSRLEQLADNEGAWTQPTPCLVPPSQLAARGAVNDTVTAFSLGDPPKSPEPPDTALVHQPFLARAQAQPERTALVSGERRMSYGELLSRSVRLAARLRSMGAVPNALVAIHMDKGWEQIVAVMAVLQSGAAYLAIDPALPETRARHLLLHGQASLVLTTPSMDARFDWPEGVEPVLVEGDLAPDDLELDDASPLPERLAPVQGPDDLAYVLYTSGSTGEPKGVEIAHRGLHNAVLATDREFEVGPDDRVLAVTALHHDMSGFDIFGVLGAGGCVVIPDPAGARDPAHWAELMRREGVTLWNSVPPMMEMLLEHAADQAGILPPSLRLAFLGGDWIAVNLPERLASVAPNAQVVSVGGPTETTMWNIWHRVVPEDRHGPSIPYGRPIANTAYHILDAQLRERPDWVAGELCVTGVGVARGYWRDPARSEQKFIAHPTTGARMCRTGDLGRWRPDGTIEFVGRLDAQVKIHGHRVELGEVESVLRTHPAVRDAVVLPVGHERQRRALAAYVLLADPSSAASSPPSVPAVEVADRASRLDFKAARHGIRKDDLASIPLLPPVGSDALLPFVTRRSYRTFGPGPVTLTQLSMLLSALRAVELDALPFPKYRYASGGGLYPVQTYLHFAPGRVEGIEPGYYYYHPVDHALRKTGAYTPIDPTIHVATNRATFEAATISLFLVADRSAIEPMYGPEPSAHFIRLEAGAMVNLIESVGPTCGLGLCQVGSIDLRSLAPHFRLGEHHMFVHGLLGGPLRDDALDPVAGVLRDWAAYDVTPASSGPGLTEQLRDYLKERLPRYMVPSWTVPLDAWPLSRTGKIDRSALPLPDRSAPKVDTRAQTSRSTSPSASPSASPSSRTEQLVAEIWRELLGSDPIGVHDNFFDMGGDSLLAMKSVSRLSEALGRKISIRQLFTHPTIAGLAAELGTSSPSTETHATSSSSPTPASPTGSPYLERVVEPLPSLIERGALPPADAAAVFSLPDSVAEHLGWSPATLLERWCGGAPQVSGLLELDTGRIAVIMLPRFTSDLYADRAALSQEIAEAARLARRIGAQVLSLTGIVSSATDYGRSVTVAADDPQISTGHATTGATVVLAIERILAEARRPLAGERVAFVGLGSIGRTTLRLMLRELPHPSSLLLCDVLSKADALEALATELRETLGYCGPIKLSASRGALPDQVYGASLIVGATNVPDILDVSRLAPGTLVVDDSVPHCFDPADAIRRFETQHDILFTEGGMVNFERPVRERRHIPEALWTQLSDAQRQTVLRHDPHALTSCVYSSLLSATDPSLSPTLGTVTPEQCLDHYRALTRLGHRAAPLHYEGIIERHQLSAEIIAEFADRFGR